MSKHNADQIMANLTKPP